MKSASNGIDLKVAANLKRQRKAKGLEAKWVASKMGISRSYFSDLEVGRRRWTESLIARFQAALNN